VTNSNRTGLASLFPAHSAGVRPWPGAWVLCVPLVVAPVASWAANCSSSGNLRYLGVSADGGKSVWLSATSPGQFELESAKGSQTVDQWSKQRRGLRISVSPDVSNGNGGTHKLYATDDGKPCLLDTQNQKNGFVFPPALPPFPPIGTLPPVTGLMPGLPGGVTPPIATLPPVTGITPGLPGGVTPPIATLPPVTGITPGLPGGVTPPIATLPPVTGVTPGLPGGVTPPIGVLVPPDGATRIAADTNVNCRVGLPARSATGSAETRAADCGESQLLAAAPAPAGAIIPLTEGRDLVVESLWNGWVDLHHIGSEDHRNGLDLDNSTGGVTLGVDRRFGANIIAGLSLSLDHSDSDGFGGAMTSQTQGFLVGPYVAHRLSNHWAADASIAWGRDQTDTQLDVLQGNYKADRTTFAFNANGQYEFDRTLVRPRLSVYYAHLSNDGYALKGGVAGQSVTLAMPKASSNYGMAEASGEVTQVFTQAGGSVVAPYARLAVRYEFERPNDGEVLAGDLSMARTSPWGGSLRVGARALADRATMIEAEAGYLSLGQSGLNVWELRLYVSHAF
jgi:hypothetical protein